VLLASAVAFVADLQGSIFRFSLALISFYPFVGCSLRFRLQDKSSGFRWLTSASILSSAVAFVSDCRINLLQLRLAHISFYPVVSCSLRFRLQDQSSGFRWPTPAFILLSAVAFVSDCRINLLQLRLAHISFYPFVGCSLRFQIADSIFWFLLAHISFYPFVSCSLRFQIAGSIFWFLLAHISFYPFVSCSLRFQIAGSIFWFSLAHISFYPFVSCSLRFQIAGSIFWFSRWE
jgi:hypothetical protein